MTETAIQDRLYGDTTCFGCGPANERGLRLKSYRDGDIVVATFQPWSEHDNGIGFLNGGIMATVLDCHSGAAVFDEADRQQWFPLGGTPFPFITAGIDVRYLRPVPLGDPVELRAVLALASEPQIDCDVELVFNDKVCATGHAVWKRWRPR